MNETPHRWERIDWERAAPALSDLMPDQLTAAADVITGRTACYWINGPGYAGTIAVQVRDMADGEREFYLVAGRGQGMANMLPVVERIAKANRCTVIGAHSSRPGYPRYAARLGLREVERYYRKELQ